MERLDLETILVVMKTGSFSKAASLLCITQSAVSHRVKLLEERLGCQLIDRSGPELAPTEAGKCVLKKAEQILQLENELKNEISRLDQRIQLSIATTATFGSAYLPKVMSNLFMNQTEKTDLKIVVKSPREIRDGLLRDDYDVAIVEHLDNMNLPEFVTITLPSDELVFTSAKVIESKQHKISLRQLLEEHLVLRNDDCSCHRLIRINLKKNGHDLSSFKNVTITDDLYLMINAAKRGEGICYVSKLLISDEIRRGSLFYYNVTGFDNKRHRSLIFKKTKIEEEIPRFFIETVLNLFDINLPQHTTQGGVKNLRG